MTDRWRSESVISTAPFGELHAAELKDKADAEARWLDGRFAHLAGCSGKTELRGNGFVNAPPEDVTEREAAIIKQRALANSLELKARQKEGVKRFQVRSICPAAPPS